MPRGIDFPIPFPSRISSDAHRAHADHLRWPRTFGFLVTRETAERHAGARYAELASRFHPTATGNGLDLGVDQMSWFFLFDDAFDSPLGYDIDWIKTLIDAITRVLDHPPWRDADPLIHAFSDLWRRSCAGMSSQWRQRAARHWRDYFSGYVTEARNRVNGIFPTADEILIQRRDTIGVQPTLDLSERIGHYEVPGSIFYAHSLIEMRRIATEIVILHNDTCSVEKEERIGDPHNTLLALERENGCTREESVRIVLRMVKDRTDAFRELRDDLPALCDHLNLDLTERCAVYRYCTDALQTVMRGDLDWAESSGRYDMEPS